MLDYSHNFPANAKDGDPLILLLHGRGSGKNDLLGLAPHLPSNALIVTPQAPFPGAQWGYGGGWAWYRFLGGTTPEPETFVQGQDALSEFVDALPGLLPVRPGPMLMGGFSQGSSTCLAYAIRNPGKVAGVFVFSGLLANHPSVIAGLATAKDLPVFWGHGTRDGMIEFATAQQGRKTLRDAGVALTTGDYPIDHAIEAAELNDARAWMDKLLA